MPTANRQSLIANGEDLRMYEMPEALLAPACYPGRVRRVKMIQTHTSWVFLTGRYVYKVKKPVDFGFLDYTTLAKRKRFCMEELRLNRRLCEWLYLDVVPISRSGAGLRVGVSEEIVDYAVKMREVPQGSIMTEMVKKKMVGLETMDRIAEVMSEFHERSDTDREISAYGSVATIRYNWEENFSQTDSMIGRLIDRSAYCEIKNRVDRFIAENERRFEERVERDRVRWLHGDFHSGNIFLTDRICVFDCIEFNQRFSCSDTAAEIAFLAMDLEFLGAKELSDHFVRKYVDRTTDTALWSFLDFYKCYRAYVRGKVLGFKAFDDKVKNNERNIAEVTAQKYFKLATLYAAKLSGRPRLIVICGLPGVGKSSVAGQLSRRLGLVHLRTDVLRKEMSGVSFDEHEDPGFSKGIYTEEMSSEVYMRMLKEAEILVRNGMGCVLDGSFRKKVLRTEAGDLARRLKAAFDLVYCTCEETVVLERLSNREDDPSDATERIYLKMKERFEAPGSDSLIIDTSQGVVTSIRGLISKLTCGE
jgi:aminoglycoside phosphotransferase family enzyme/predicted kinase